MPAVTWELNPGPLHGPALTAIALSIQSSGHPLATAGTMEAFPLRAAI